MRMWLLAVMPGVGFSAPYTAVVMDPYVAAVVAEVHCHKIIYPASLTKMMTLYLLFEGLSKGKITLDTLFKVSKRASQQPPTKFWVKAGQRISVRDCILALAVRSANDVAVVVAENLSPSFSDFIGRMNQAAKKLYMTRTRFCNPSGWHHPHHYSTAYDLALLMRALWEKFPQYTAFLRVPFFKRASKIYRNTNKLQGKVSGMQMGKTGYTSHAGWNLAAFVERKQRPLIIVVVGMANHAQRDCHMFKLIQVAYEHPYRLHQLLRAPLCKQAKR